MTRLTVSFLMVSACLIPAVDAAAQGGKPKPGCGSDVSLSVTISGSRSAPGNYALTSDGAGAYVDGGKGAARVSAIFQVENCTHDFTMNLHNSARSMWALLSGGDQRAWFFNLDRVHSVPITPQTQSESEAFVAGHPFCTGGIQRTADGLIRKDQQGWYYDNYAGCGVDDSGRAFVRRAGGSSLDPDDRLSFKVSPVDNPNAACVVDPSGPTCATSYLRVYHPDVNTWVIRAESPATASHRVWAGGDAGYIFAAYETVPLEITAVRK